MWYPIFYTQTGKSPVSQTANIVVFPEAAIWAKCSVLACCMYMMIYVYVDLATRLYFVHWQALHAPHTFTQIHEREGVLFCSVGHLYIMCCNVQHIFTQREGGLYCSLRCLYTIYGHSRINATFIFSRVDICVYSVSLGQVNKIICFKSEFSKKKEEEGLFIFYL